MALTRLGNFRLKREDVLPAPLDAKPNAQRAQQAVDPILAALVVALIGFGVVMVYSASAVVATTQNHDAQYYLKRQTAYAAVAMLLLFGLSRFDYHRLYKLTYPFLIGTAVLSILCVSGLGHSAGGATRWIALGPIHIQPAELAKLSIVSWLAYSLAKKAERVKHFTVGFLPHLLVAGVFIALCMKQSDFGSSVMILLLTFTLLFVAGAKVGYILGAVMLGGVFGVISITSKAYRYARYVAWLDMDAHRQDLAYQPYQSVMSFGSGGFSGMGLGKGLQTLYLPEAHTDFIAAIIGEELGFLGILALVGVYLMLVVRGVRTALRAPDDYGSYLAFGISTLFGAQALINLSVALSLLPTKGLTLPFISSGGSSLLVNTAAAGVLLAISRQIPTAPDRSEELTPEAPPVSAPEPRAALSLEPELDDLEPLHP